MAIARGFTRILGRRIALCLGGMQFKNGVYEFDGVTVPVNGTSGTGANFAPPGSVYRRTNGEEYINSGTKLSPTWIRISSTTDWSLGGSGIPGTAGVMQEFTKEVTGIVDATATAILTVTIPNSAQAGMIEFDIIGRLGAGGAIGADEAVSSSKYQATFIRTAGVASVLTLSSQANAVNVAVAGAATVTCVLTTTATGEGVGVANTHLIKVTITKSGGASAAHKADVHVRIHNANASGVTVS